MPVLRESHELDARTQTAPTLGRAPDKQRSRLDPCERTATANATRMKLKIANASARHPNLKGVRAGGAWTKEKNAAQKPAKIHATQQNNSQGKGKFSQNAAIVFAKRPLSSRRQSAPSQANRELAKQTA